MPVKEWKPGKSDAVWKLMVCARDAARVDEILSEMVAILTSTGGDRERGIAEMKEMSGREIVDGLLGYQARAYESVKMAYDDRTSTEA